MLRTKGQIINAALVRAGVTTTTSGLFTDTIMQDTYMEAYQWVAAQHKWPNTEGRVSTTFTGSEEVSYPEGWKSDTIRYMEIDGKRYDKTLFKDYKAYREDNASGGDRIYSDFCRTIFVNTGAGGTGTLTVYGQYTPVDLGVGGANDSGTDYTDISQTTVFSHSDSDGNEAIVNKMVSLMKEREKKPDEEQFYETKSLNIIEKLYQRIGGEQFGYKPKDAEMFQRFDVLEGENWDETINRDRFF